MKTHSIPITRLMSATRRFVPAALTMALAAFTLTASPAASQPPPKPPVFTDSTEVHYIPFNVFSQFRQEELEDELQVLWDEGDVDIFPSEQVRNMHLITSSTGGIPELIIEQFPSELGGGEFPNWNELDWPAGSSDEYWTTPFSIQAPFGFTLPPAQDPRRQVESVNTRIMGELHSFSTGKAQGNFHCGTNCGGRTVKAYLDFYPGVHLKGKHDGSGVLKQLQSTPAALGIFWPVGWTTLGRHYAGRDELDHGCHESGGGGTESCGWDAQLHYNSMATIPHGEFSAGGVTFVPGREMELRFMSYAGVYSKARETGIGSNPGKYLIDLDDVAYTLNYTGYIEVTYQLGSNLPYVWPATSSFTMNETAIGAKAVTLPESFTVSAEVRIDGSEQWEYLTAVGGFEFGDNAPFALGVGDEGQWHVSIGDGTSFADAQIQGTWTYGQWTQVKVTYDQGVCTLYENNQLLHEFTADKDVGAVWGQIVSGGLALGVKNAHGELRGVSYTEGVYNLQGGGAPVFAPPVIALNGPSDVTLRTGEVYTEQATASDYNGDDLPLSVDGSVGTELGNYTLTYTATDGLGMTATATRTVSVIPLPHNIRVVHTGKCLDVVVASQDNGANVQQWDCHGGTNQDWDLVPDGTHFQIKAAHSGKCLGVESAQQQNGANVQQWDCQGLPNETWELVPAGENFQLKAAHSGRCLGVVSALQNDGANIQQWDCQGLPNETWEITSQDGTPFVLD